MTENIFEEYDGGYTAQLLQEEGIWLIYDKDGDYIGKIEGSYDEEPTQEDVDSLVAEINAY